MYGQRIALIQKRFTMKIIVCMKQVPASTKVDIDPETGAMKRMGSATRTNPYDLFALETALQLRELVGGTVTALTMGPPQAEVMMKDAYTMGADEAVILSDRKFAGADVLATSYALSQGIQVLGGADLIICGRQTTDGDTAQVGAEVSEYLGIPNVANVLSVDDVKDGKIYVTASLDEKVVKMSVALPCLISVDGDINSPRLPSYKAKKALTGDEVRFLSFADFGDQNADHYGLTGSATQVERIFPPEKKKERATISGTPEEKTEALFGILADKKLI